MEGRTLGEACIHRGYGKQWMHRMHSAIPWFMVIECHGGATQGGSVTVRVWGNNTGRGWQWGCKGAAEGGSVMVRVRGSSTGSVTLRVWGSSTEGVRWWGCDGATQGGSVMVRVWGSNTEGVWWWGCEGATWGVSWWGCKGAKPGERQWRKGAKRGCEGWGAVMHVWRAAEELSYVPGSSWSQHFWRVRRKGRCITVLELCEEHLVCVCVRGWRWRGGVKRNSEYMCFGYKIII